MPCSYSNEPEFFVKEKGGVYPGLILSDTDDDIIIEGAAAEQLTNALRGSVPLQERICRSPATPSSPFSLQPSIIAPIDTTPSSPMSTLAEPGWGERVRSVTFANVAPNSPVPYPVVSVDVPIHGHRLVDQFLDQDGMTSMQESL